ncbi:porin family protein [Vibrio cholerae]|nr:porin family protein [Vibrio cholerae]
MKLSNLAFLSCMVFTQNVYASADPSINEPEREFYIGLGLSFANTIMLESGDISLEENSDFGKSGFGLSAGYEFTTHKQVSIDVEAEYRQLGKVNYSNILDVSGSGVFVNVKPKLFVNYEFGDVYLAPFGGVGLVKVDAKSPINNIAESETELGYQLGIELGFKVNRSMDIMIGYRSAQVEVDSVTTSFGSGYLGGRYYF